MRTCDQLVTVSEPLAAQIKWLHGREAKVIYSGYDEEDYAVEVPLTAKFTLTFTGTMYENRDPSPLFAAVSSLKNHGLVSLEGFEIRFFEYDLESRYLRDLIDKHGLQDLVKIYPAVPYQQCVQKQKESTALLFVGWKDPKEIGIISTKIFEYFGSGRPILSLSSPEEVVSKFIMDARCGVVTLDSREIQNILLVWTEEFRKYKNIISHQGAGAITRSKFTRREQTRRLADVFNNFTC